MMKSLLGALSLAVVLAVPMAPAFALDEEVQLFCRGGGNMKIENLDTGFAIHFDKANKAANDQLPRPGQCAMLDRPLDGKQVGLLFIERVKKNALLLLAAAKGGTFQVKAKDFGFFTVEEVGLVNVEDAQPAGDGANADDDNDEVAKVEDGDGMNVGECSGTSAIVVIPEPDLTKLNVRDKPNGKVRGTIPEGTEVEVVGQCGAKAAVGFAKGKGKKGTPGWCQIDKPLAGCVKAKYLDFDGDGGLLDDAAGFAKKRKG